MREKRRDEEMRISSDLRKRVIEFVKGGGSKAEAARRYGVGKASVYRWLKACAPLSYKRPGPCKGWRLDKEALLAHVKTHNEMTYEERAKHFGVSRSCIWYGLRQLKISRKKKYEVCGARPNEKTPLFTIA